jgi:hypothetical protein
LGMPVRARTCGLRRRVTVDFSACIGKPFAFVRETLAASLFQVV